MARAMSPMTRPKIRNPMMLMRSSPRESPAKLCMAGGPAPAWAAGGGRRALRAAQIATAAAAAESAACAEGNDWPEPHPSGARTDASDWQGRERSTAGLTTRTEIRSAAPTATIRSTAASQRCGERSPKYTAMPPATARSRYRLEAAAIRWSSDGDPSRLTRRRSWRSKGGGIAPDGIMLAPACSPALGGEPSGRPGDTPFRGGADGEDGEVRQAPARAARPGVQAVPQRPGAAHLRQRLPGSVEDVAGAFQDDHERVPPRRRERAGEPDPVRPGREVLLRRGRGAPARLQAARGQGVGCASPATS